MKAVKVVLIAALFGLAFLALAALPQSEQSKDYLNCAKHGWPPEVCAAKLGYETGEGK